MADHVERLTQAIRTKLRSAHPPAPALPVLRQLLETAYLASLRTEEGRFIRGSLTYANPRNPDPEPPLLRRAAYPSFTPFRRRVSLNVDSLVKLARAIDNWSGSIAVYGTKRSNIVAWGLLDQLVHRNVRLNREGSRGAPQPGVFSILMDGVGDLSVYRGDLFLGGLRQDRLIWRENEALTSTALIAQLLPEVMPVARQITAAVGVSANDQGATLSVLRAWSSTVARLCIGLRRLGTGGAFLFSPAPIEEMLEVAHPLNYYRLRDALVLGVLDASYVAATRKRWLRHTSHAVPRDVVTQSYLAEADAEDREDELAGSVRVVTSLAAVDGLVLVNPLLVVQGFGVKIRSGGGIGRLYDGPDFIRRGTRARIVDTSRFGTRHASLLRYCRADRRAFGVVVSQDGHVRVIMSSGRSLTMWSDVKLLSYQHDLRSYMREEQRRQAFRLQLGMQPKQGYTGMPKTFSALMALVPTAPAFAKTG